MAVYDTMDDDAAAPVTSLRRAFGGSSNRKWRYTVTHVHGPWKSKAHELTGLQRTFPEKYLSRVISLSPPKKPLDRDSESTSAASTVDTLSSCRQHVEKTLSATCGNTQLGNMWKKFDVPTCGMLSTGIGDNCVSGLPNPCGGLSRHL